MSDWYLAQAGFGEQIQLYGEAFWRQLGSTLLWTFLAVWIVLLFVAIAVTVSRQADVNREIGGARGLDEGRRATRRGTVVLRRGATRRADSEAKEKPAPPKVA